MGRRRASARKQAAEVAKSEVDRPYGGALVPFLGVSGINPGIQAFRRGDIILYTVRGEPKQVLELMGHLDREGVGEVVALISHHAGEPTAPPAAEPEDSPR